MGIILGIILWFFIKLNIVIYVILMIPLIIDGTVQMFTKYESNNTKRFITGVLFGYSLVSIHIISMVYVYNLGVKYARSI